MTTTCNELENNFLLKNGHFYLEFLFRSLSACFEKKAMDVNVINDVNNSEE